MVRDILGAYAKRWPAFMRGCLRRHSGANKIALIGRGNITRRQGRTARYFAEPDDTGGKGHMVEFFGRNAKRLMAVHGQHSEGRVYGYHGDAIWDRPLDSLPWFQNEGIILPTRYGNNKEWVIEEETEVLGIASEIMVKHGLVWRETSADRGAGCVNASSTRRLYDLEPEMVIDLADDSAETLTDLEAMVEAGITWLGNPRNPTRLAAYANLWDPGSTTRDRVLIAIGSTGLCLWDTKFDISHRWKHRAPPPDDLGDRIKALWARRQAERGQS